jgi:DNA-binding transcriptional regulator YiaG
LSCRVTNVRSITQSEQLIEIKNIFESTEMEQVPIGERLKILMTALGLKVRPFAQTLAVSETTVRNYTERGSKPSSEFLENIITHFEDTNPVFLLTGKGEPLLKGRDSQASHIKNNYGNSVGSNNKGGTVTQHHGGVTNTDERDTKLALAEKEIESLRTQLAMQAALLASKDETIAVLKSAFNRPN